jgi:hypothetical protein
LELLLFWERVWRLLRWWVAELGLEEFSSTVLLILLLRRRNRDGWGDGAMGADTVEGRKGGKVLKKKRWRAFQFREDVINRIRFYK